MHLEVRLRKKRFINDDGLKMRCEFILYEFEVDLNKLLKVTKPPHLVAHTMHPFLQQVLKQERLQGSC